MIKRPLPWLVAAFVIALSATGQPASAQQQQPAAEPEPETTTFILWRDNLSVLHRLPDDTTLLVPANVGSRLITALEQPDDQVSQTVQALAAEDPSLAPLLVTSLASLDSSKLVPAVLGAVRGAPESTIDIIVYLVEGGFDAGAAVAAIQDDPTLGDEIKIAAITGLQTTALAAGGPLEPGARRPPDQALPVTLTAEVPSRDVASPDLL